MDFADQSDSASDPAVAGVRVHRISERSSAVEPDVLAVEEPLEIRVAYDGGQGTVHASVSVTMRTPGNDRELAVGFLFSEGIVTEPEQVADVRICGADNVACVKLRAGVSVDLRRLERHFYASSSCGVCGKTSLDALRIAARYPVPNGGPIVDPTVIQRLPATLRPAQTTFDRTGGLHAAGLFDPAGNLLCLREDVGRHNALDKVIGAQFLDGRMPLHANVLLVSGRAGFELVQKAVVAGIPVLGAVGAPSSLAVNLALEHRMTLVGFIRSDGFNVYAGAERFGVGAASTARSFSAERAATLGPASPPATR
jgi:FdhD protein